MTKRKVLFSSIVFLASVHLCGPMGAQSTEAEFSLQNGDTNGDSLLDVTDYREPETESEEEPAAMEPAGLRNESTAK